MAVAVEEVVEEEFVVFEGGGGAERVGFVIVELADEDGIGFENVV